jgi:integrase
MRLSDRIIRPLPVPAHGNKVTYDDEVKGFGIRVTAAGSRAFIITYRRKADGKQRRFTIGSFPDWSTSAAREEAKRLKRQIDGGADPIGELLEGRAAPTVADLAERFLSDYVPRRRVSTQRDYKRQIAVNILPAIGDLKVDAVAFGDIDRLHRAISKRAPTQANRTIAVLSRMFTLAKRWEIRTGDNPCKSIERNQEHKRQRYLTPVELIRLATALTALRDQGAANAVRLMLLTGARRGETLQAKWSDFDLVAGVWTKPGATTKQKTTHRVPLSGAAIALLKGMAELAPTKQVYFVSAAGRPDRLPARPR